MSWNHRIVRSVNRHPAIGNEPAFEELFFAVHEVYYNEDGSIHNWTERSVGPCGNSIEELLSELEMFREAADQPILQVVVGRDGDETLEEVTDGSEENLTSWGKRPGRSYARPDHHSAAHAQGVRLLAMDYLISAALIVPLAAFFYLGSVNPTTDKLEVNFFMVAWILIPVLAYLNCGLSPLEYNCLIDNTATQALGGVTRVAVLFSMPFVGLPIILYGLVGWLLSLVLRSVWGDL